MNVIKEAKKKRHPSLKWLWGFLIVTVQSVVIYFTGAVLDMLLNNNVQQTMEPPGHPGAITFLFMIIGVGFFIFGNLLMLIIFIVSLIRNKIEKEKEQQLFSENPSI